MKRPRKPYKLKKRNDRGGQYAIIDKATGKSRFTGTTDKHQAEEQARIKYGLSGEITAAHHRKMAEAHWMHCNAAWNTNTWDDVFEDWKKRGRKTKGGGPHKPSTIKSMNSVWNNSCWDHIRNKRCIDTMPNELLDPLTGRGRGFTQLIRGIHNHAVGYSLTPYAIVGSKLWPTHRCKSMSRAITLDEHLELVESMTDPASARSWRWDSNQLRSSGGRRTEWNADVTPEEWQRDWVAYLWVLWFTGASNTDAASLKAEDINWKTMVLEFARGKWVNGDDLEPCRVSIGSKFSEILRQLPKEGLLLPFVGRQNQQNRGRFFKSRVTALDIKGVTIHGYRYAFTERAKESGMSIEDRMTTLGHNNYAVHARYGKGAKSVPVSIEVLDGGLEAA